MPNWSHAADSDPLGLAVADDIVLVDVSPVLSADVVDILNEEGIVLKSSGKKVGEVHEVTITYELKAASLVLALGVDIEDLRVVSASGNYSAEGYPTVSVTAVKGAGSTTFATGKDHGTITFPGGFGVPTTFFGATVTGGISASASVSGQVAKAIGGNTGNVLADGLVVYGFRGVDVSVEAYSAIAVPTGAIQTSKSDTVRTGRESYEIHSLGFRQYLVSN